MPEAADITVGGSSGWANGIQYSPLKGQQGDVLVSGGIWSKQGACNILQVMDLYSQYSIPDLLQEFRMQDPWHKTVSPLFSIM